MDYFIQVKNSKGKFETIAMFENQVDRDDCLGFLADRYIDCYFKAKDNIN